MSRSPPAHNKRRRTSGHGPSSSPCDSDSTRSVMARNRGTLVPGKSGSLSIWPIVLCNEAPPQRRKPWGDAALAPARELATCRKVLSEARDNLPAALR